MWWWAGLGCHGGPDDVDGRGDPSPAHSDDTGVVDPLGVLTTRPALADPPASARLVQRIVFSTSVPAVATVVVDDGVRARRLRWAAPRTEHDLLLAELHQGRDHAVTLTLEAEDGRTVTRELAFRTEAVDFALPDLELLANDGAEPGLRVVPVGIDGVPFVVLAVDVDGDVVYAAKTGADSKALSWLPRGAFGLLERGDAEQLSLLGRRESVWAGALDWQEGETPVDVDSFHHELVFRDDGSFWSFYKVDRQVADFPIDARDLSVRAEVTINDDHVVRVGADGAVLSDWSLADRLDPTRITADSLAVSADGVALDWAHANGISPVPGEDAILVSMRHQDAVIELDGSGRVRWILGNHDGWPAALQPLLLTPIGDLKWPYHQHAPQAEGGGRLLLFDNGNAHRTNPYAADPERGPEYSRLVKYEVDETAMTVRQVSAQVVGTPPLFAKALGNADRLPRTGHVFGTFAYLTVEDGVRNADVGRGDSSVRLVELDLETGTRHWDLRIGSDRDVNALGYQGDRAIVVPTLYPPEVEATWLE